MVIELYRVACPDCGLKTEKVDSLPSKAPFRKRFEDAVGMLRECPHTSSGTAVWTPESTVRAMDLRYLRRWAARRRRPALRQMGVDEIYLGKKQKFLTVVCICKPANRSGSDGNERKQRWISSSPNS